MPRLTATGSGRWTRSLPAEAQAGPPLQPRPTEEAEWARFGERVPEEPSPWLGELPNYEFSVDTRGNVTTSEGAWIENPQGAAAMVEKVRRRPGGRFRVTPLYNLVVVYGEGGQGMLPFVAGRLGEPFRLREDAADADREIDMASLAAGRPYPGPTDRTQGSFKLRQKHGGVIERKQGTTSAFALTEGDAQDPKLGNARRLLEAWGGLGTTGLTFYINKLGHAWYREGGAPRFLAAVPGGFHWPDSPSVESATPEGGSD